MTRRALVEYLPLGPPQRHLYELVADYPLRPSKMLRATLCLATCRAFGGSVDDAMQSAVAIELLHNAFMIHDDIEDDSEIRRGRPTLHREHGVPIALNVGDAMSMLALRPMLDNAERFGLNRTIDMVHEFIGATERTIEGQAIELGWMSDGAFDITEADYLEMVMLKTCWYTTILPCRLGALAAGVELEPSSFVAYGTFFGSAFQIRDDVLNIDGDGTAYGKEIGGDIQEGKRTLLLLHALDHCAPDERSAIEWIFGKDRADRTSTDVSFVIDLMRQCGSIEHASSSAHGLAGAALAEYEAAFSDLPQSDDRDFLREIVVHLTNRQR